MRRAEGERCTQASMLNRDRSMNEPFRQEVHEGSDTPGQEEQ